MRTARTYPSAATISSPTITSVARCAFLVLEAMRSSRTRVVTTIDSAFLRAGADRQERRDGGHPREAGRFIAGPEAVLLAVGGHGGIHHGMRAARAGHLEPAGRETHPRLPRHPLLRRRDERLDVPAGGVEPLPLVQPVAVEAAELVLPEELPLGGDELLEL